MVIFVSKISYIEKLSNYHKIYEQLYEDPFIPTDAIARNIHLSRGTVSKYIREMYEKKILIGPHLHLKPTTNYSRYMGLYRFSDPLSVYRGLTSFPHVISHALTAGDCNILAFTDQPLDFSQLKGFQSLVYWKTMGKTSAPLVMMQRWDNAFQDIQERIEQGPYVNLQSMEPVLHLNWGVEEWKLFHAFRFDIRQKITPILKEKELHYETYRSWKKTLKDCCSFVTMFYPEGFDSYGHHWVACETRYSSTLKEIFSLLPTSPLITVLDKGVLMLILLPYPHQVRQFFCILYDLKTAGIIHRFWQAIMINRSVDNTEKER
jgi:hypothetical protein